MYIYICIHIYIASPILQNLEQFGRKNDFVRILEFFEGKISIFLTKLASEFGEPSFEYALKTV